MFINSFAFFDRMNLKDKWEKLFDGDYIKANIMLTEMQLNEKNEDRFPELISLCGEGLAKKIVREAGSLKKLALMRYQTIYTLGSKRFFNSGMRKQEAGIISEHPEFWKGGMELAKNISIAARKDYFKKD